MKKLFAILLIYCLPLPVLAADWRPVGQEPTFLYIDTESITLHNNGQVSFWLKVIDKSTPPIEATYMHTVYDCPNKAQKIDQAAFYGSNDKKIGSSHYDKPFEPLEPDSDELPMLNAFCQTAQSIQDEYIAEYNRYQQQKMDYEAYLLEKQKKKENRKKILKVFGAGLAGFGNGMSQSQPTRYNCTTYGTQTNCVGR